MESAEGGAAFGSQAAPIAEATGAATNTPDYP